MGQSLVNLSKVVGQNAMGNGAGIFSEHKSERSQGFGISSFKKRRFAGCISWKWPRKFPLISVGRANSATVHNELSKRRSDSCWWGRGLYAYPSGAINTARFGI